MLRKILLVILLCSLSWNIYAASCQIVSVGTSESGSGSTLDMSGNMPATYQRGDLLLFWASSFSNGAVSSTDPTGWTLITQFNNASTEVWGYIADSTSVTAPTLVWSGGASSGFITAVRNPDGFPALIGILGDFASGTTSAGAISNLRFNSLTVTQGGECSFQGAVKLLNDGGTNPVTAVGVTSGYISAGSAWSNATNRSLIAAQMFDGDATVPDLATNDVATTGNTTTNGQRRASFTLLDGDVAPTAFSFTDVTGATLSTEYISDEITVAGITNYAQISITGSNCEFSIEGAAYTNITTTVGVGEGVTVRTTSSSSANTAVNCVLTIGSGSDTYSVTTAVGATETVPHLVTDLFTGTNGTAINSHSPDRNVPANAWVSGVIQTGASVGTAEIQSNQFRMSKDMGAVIDLETPDAYIEVTWTTPSVGTTAMTANSIMRWEDSDDFHECRFNGTTVVLRRAVANVYTTLASTSFALLNNTTYRIRSFAIGDQLGCIVDNNVVVTAISSIGNTRTKFGWGSRNNDGQLLNFDNFYAMKGYRSILADTQKPSDDPQGFFYQTSVQDGSVFWASPVDLPDETYVSWFMYDGGSWYYDPEVDFVGNDRWGIEHFNSATSQIESAQVTYTTVSDTPATPPSWGTIPDQQLETGVPFSLDLCQYLTTAGIPPATLTLQSGSFATGLNLLPDGCTLAGVPSTASGSPFTATVRATNASGTDDDTFTLTVTAQTGEPPICQPLPTQYLQVGTAVTINLASQCQNTSSITMGTLATGLTNNSGIVSGVPTMKQQIATEVLASNSAGSYSFRLTQIVRDRASNVSIPIRN